MMNSIAINDYISPVKPNRWPFPPRRPNPSRTRPVPDAPQNVCPVPRAEKNAAPAALRREAGVFQGASRGQIVTDVLMVAAWGIMIPGGLWLGHWLGV